MAVLNGQRKFFVLLVAVTMFCIVPYLLTTRIEEQQQSRTLLSLGDPEPSGGGQCTISSDCGEGMCNLQNGTGTNGTCSCESQFAQSNCQYTRKSKKTAFWLSFFLGSWGADRFYLGWAGLGCAKLIFTIVPCFLSCYVRVRRALLKAQSEGVEKPTLPPILLALTCAVLLLYLLMMVWWMTDWILILKNSTPDHAGYSLYNNL